MKFMLGLFLLALLPAVAQTKCHKTVPEAIPYNAIEPVLHNYEPYCPRDDYQLKWFIVKDTTTVYPTYGVYASGTLTTTVPSYTVENNKLVFKAMCVQSELVNDTESHFTIKMKGNN